MSSSDPRSSSQTPADQRPDAELQVPDSHAAADESNPAGSAAALNGENATDSNGNLADRLADAEAKALRYQADLENYRRRARRDADEQLRYANLPLISELLETYDNLRRAVDATQPAAESEELATGVRMVVQQLESLLAKYGCHRIPAEGEMFDPNLHQAVQAVELPDRPENQIVQELRAGYRLHDRVVRPSQVIVVKR